MRCGMVRFTLLKDRTDCVADRLGWRVRLEIRWSVIEALAIAQVRSYGVWTRTVVERLLKERCFLSLLKAEPGGFTDWIEGGT